jgi:hypothetical protein
MAAFLNGWRLRRDRDPELERRRRLRKQFGRVVAAFRTNWAQAALSSRHSCCSHRRSGPLSFDDCQPVAVGCNPETSRGCSELRGRPGCRFGAGAEGRSMTGTMTVSRVRRGRIVDAARALRDARESRS